MQVPAEQANSTAHVVPPVPQLQAALTQRSASSPQPAEANGVQTLPTQQLFPVHEVLSQMHVPPEHFWPLTQAGPEPQPHVPFARQVLVKVPLVQFEQAPPPLPHSVLVAAVQVVLSLQQPAQPLRVSQIQLPALHR